MITPILICLIAVIAFIRAYKFMYSKPDNFPPGPPRFPYIGNYIMMLLLDPKYMHKAADFLCRYYKTNVLGIYFGNLPTIVCNDAVSVKEALYKREFDGKPQQLLSQLRTPDFKIRGVFFTEGDLWHEQRRFMLRYLRDYGFGRRFDELELEQRDEFRMFVDIVKNGPKYDHERVYIKENGLVLSPVGFAPYMANGFMKVMFNEKVPRSDQHIFIEMVNAGLEFVRQGDAYGKLFSHAPIFAKLFPKSSDYSDLRRGAMQFHAAVKKLIDRQVETYDSNHIRSYLDLYLKEINDAKARGDENTTFTYEQLIVMTLDFLTPSLVANSVAVTQVLQALCTFPDVQKKVQDEIDHVVGQGRLPALDDRINLSYTEATIREAMRWHTLIPSGITHTSMEDTQFMGYDIPKGTFVMTAFYSSHRDPSIWEEPEAFMPERFLDASGKLCLNKDKSVPFSAGRRLCAGETFARNSVFLLVTALMQNFKVGSPEGEKIPDLRDSPSGVFCMSPNFWFKFDSR